MTVDVAFRLDALSALMLSFVTFVGTLIHLYSVGYLQDEEGYGRYFAYLNLFMFAMLTLVLANNLPVLFIGWEGVGPLLVPPDRLLLRQGLRARGRQEGVRREPGRRLRDDPRDLRDPRPLRHDGLLVRRRWRSRAPLNGGAPITVYAVCLLLFLGAFGKSAQVPLYVWLPDAMAGPTPVSALIHAATMVTAGVYLVARCSAVFVLAPGRPDARRLDRRRRPRSSRPRSASPRTTSRRSSPTRRSRSSGTCSSPAASGRSASGCSTSSRTPSSRPASSSAPARSSWRCTTSRTCGRWAA